MPDDEDTELQKIIKKMDKQLAEEIAARKELERKLADMEKIVTPAEEEKDVAEQPSVEDIARKMADYIDEEKKTKETKRKRKEEKYRVPSKAELDKEASDLLHKMLMEVSEEEEE